MTPGVPIGKSQQPPSNVLTEFAPGAAYYYISKIFRIGRISLKSTLMMNYQMHSWEKTGIIVRTLAPDEFFTFIWAPVKLTSEGFRPRESILLSRGTIDACNSAGSRMTMPGLRIIWRIESRRKHMTGSELENWIASTFDISRSGTALNTQIGLAYQNLLTL